MYEKTGVKSLFKIYNDLRQSHFILDVFPLKLWELKKKIKSKSNSTVNLRNIVNRCFEKRTIVYWCILKLKSEPSRQLFKLKGNRNWNLFCSSLWLLSYVFVFIIPIYIHCLRPNIFTFTTKRLKFSCSLDLPSYSYLFQVNYKNMTTLSSKTLHLDFFPLYFIVTCI